MKRLVALLALSAPVFAQTPAPDPDANAPAASPAQNRQPKQLPPPGVKIPDADRAELSAAVAELGKELASLTANPLYADAALFHKAVDWALRYDEFYNVKEVSTARDLLKEGRARAAALKAGKAPWIRQTGPVVRGYRSKIDGSVQPFGVVVPSTWKGAGDKAPRATWIWNHGRSETLTELSFIAQRMKSAGEFSPENTFVVHPYGRYCNATKFAGEVDVFEALDATRRGYPVDNNRLVNAGFSMGGASAWHLAAHYSGLWAASHAGAGFAESAEYAGVFAAGKTPPPWWEVVLYRWYDATVCAANLANHPMFAYHGSEDKQGQATQIMKRFAEKEGVKIEEFIGPGVGHKYEPGTKKELLGKIEARLSKNGEHPPNRSTRYVGFAPLYPSGAGAGWADWIQPLRFEKQWERADIVAKFTEGESRDAVAVTTKNVQKLLLETPHPYNSSRPRASSVTVNGKHIGEVFAGFNIIERKGDSWGITFYDPGLFHYRTPSEIEEMKKVVERISEGSERIDLARIGPSIALARGEISDRVRKQIVLGGKSPILCGPIDHAFMDSFVFVKPTAAPLNAALGEWTQRELAHATKQWRGIFRGDAQAMDDSQLTDAQIKASHLILWGDPSSNSVLRRIADKLPVKWTAEGVEFGGKKYGPSHVPVLIFPNPLNPQRYVVLNSGFTFSRAAASGTNSLQTPKLPDWAIVDTSVPPDDKFPGKIADAGFFDEQWKFTTERPK